MIWKVPPSAIVSDALVAMRRTAHLAVPLALAFELPLIATQLLADEPLPYEAKALFSLISLVSQGAILVLAHAALRGEPLDVAAALRLSLRSYARMFISAIVSELLVIFFLLLLVVPGILRALSYAVAIPVAIHEGHMGRGACDVSAERTLGSRWAIALTVLPAWLFPNVLDLALLAAETDGVAALQSPGSAALVSIGMALAFLPLLYAMAAVYARTLPAAPAPDPADREPAATRPRESAPARGRAKARSPRRGRG